MSRIIQVIPKSVQVIVAALILCTVFGSPVLDLSGTCGPCREDWAFSIVPSCAHCTCQPKNECVFAWSKGCVTSSDVPCNVSLSSPYYEGSSSSALVYGNMLLRNCTNEFEVCLSSENCSMSYDRFLFQALIEEGQRSPMTFCDQGGQCSPEFQALAACAENIADQVPCISDQDCPRFSHTCDLTSGHCRPSTCCHNMSRLNCCRCQFGSLNSTDFCNLYCSENYTTHPEVPFTCCSECGRVCNPSQCDALQCPRELQQIPVGGCCPECVGCQDEFGAWHNFTDIFQYECKTCVCLPNGEILCESNCPELYCPQKLQQTTGPCCATCLGCESPSGEIRNITETWTNGCQQCTCTEYGQITCDTIQCPPPACSPEYWVNTTCCPICAECRYNNTSYNVGDTWTDNNCRECTCTGSGNVDCNPVKCPALTCPTYLQATAPGQCCPQCMACQDTQSQWHPWGTTWSNGCNSCFCYQGQSLCSPMYCPAPNCPPSQQHVPSGQCCAVCKGCTNSQQSNACDLLSGLGLCQSKIPSGLVAGVSSANATVQDICGSSCGCCSTKNGQCACDDNLSISNLFGSYGIKTCKQILGNPSITCDNAFFGHLLKKLCPCECPQ